MIHCTERFKSFQPVLRLLDEEYVYFEGCFLRKFKRLREVPKGEWQ